MITARWRSTYIMHWLSGLLKPREGALEKRDDETARQLLISDDRQSRAPAGSTTGASLPLTARQNLVELEVVDPVVLVEIHLGSTGRTVGRGRIHFIQVDSRSFRRIRRQVGCALERGEHRAHCRVKLPREGAARDITNSIVRIMLTVLYWVLSRCFHLVEDESSPDPRCDARRRGPDRSGRRPR